MDSNYITLIVCVVGFISTLLTHKYHINLHSKKIETIEQDISKLLAVANSLSKVTDSNVSNVVAEVNNTYNKVIEDIDSMHPLG